MLIACDVTCYLGMDTFVDYEIITCDTCIHSTIYLKRCIVRKSFHELRNCFPSRLIVRIILNPPQQAGISQSTTTMQPEDIPAYLMQLPQASQRQDEQAPTQYIHIRNVPQHITQNHVLSTCISYGPVSNIYISPENSNNNHHRHQRYAFVTFDLQADAHHAVINLHRSQFFGNLIYVQFTTRNRIPSV